MRSLATAGGACTVEPGQALQHVLATQHLAPGSAGENVVAVADDLIGLHATSPVTPYLSLHARVDSFRAEDLEQELYERRSLLRLKCMRGTVFIVSRELAPVAYAATRAATEAGERRWLSRSQDVYDQWAPKVLESLAGSASSAAELRKQLGADDRLAGVVSLLCDDARIVRDRPMGGRQSNAFRYRRWDDVFPDLDLTAIPEPDAAALLVGRYVAAYGPVTLHDVVWWSGVPTGKVRAALSALGDTLVEVRLRDDPERYLMTERALSRLTGQTDPPDRGVALLPELDPLLMGYRSRDRFFDPGLRPFLVDRGGNVTSVVLVGGRVAGVWDLADHRRPAVRVLLFDRRHLRRESVLERCAAVGRFWFGEPVPVIEYATMTPLTERSGVMRRPLDDAVPAD